MEASHRVPAVRVRLCPPSPHKWAEFCIFINLFNELFEAFLLVGLLSEGPHLAYFDWLLQFEADLGNL